MKLRYLSDIHLEFIKSNEFKNFIKKIPPGLDEICILAGDIGNPYQTNYDAFMEFISRNFKKTFVIAGNHEYYNESKTIQETNEFLHSKKWENISFLDNTYEYYENHYFIGTTLWSKITNPQYAINDVYNIPKFDYIQYNQLNTVCVDFLENTLNNKNNCIIITHHMPSYKLIDAKYNKPHIRNYNQWFYCDMHNFIERNKDKIKCWIYGHTHIPQNTILYDIPFLCNPIGYPNENNTNDFEKTITIY